MTSITIEPGNLDEYRIRNMRHETAYFVRPYSESVTVGYNHNGTRFAANKVATVHKLSISENGLDGKLMSFLQQTLGQGQEIVSFDRWNELDVKTTYSSLTNAGFIIQTDFAELEIYGKIDISLDPLAKTDEANKILELRNLKWNELQKQFIEDMKTNVFAHRNTIQFPTDWCPFFTKKLEDFLNELGLIIDESTTKIIHLFDSNIELRDVEKDPIILDNINKNIWTDYISYCFGGLIGQINRQIDNKRRKTNIIWPDDYELVITNIVFPDVLRRPLENYYKRYLNMKTAEFNVTNNSCHIYFKW